MVDKFEVDKYDDFVVRDPRRTRGRGQRGGDIVRRRRGRGWGEHKIARLDGPTGFPHLDVELDTEDPVHMTFLCAQQDLSTVKILFVEEVSQKKFRLIGPDFGTPQEAAFFATHSPLAWPTDSGPVDFKHAKEHGILNAWRDVWTMESAGILEIEDEDDFIENHNSCAVFIQVPGSFANPLLEPIYHAPAALEHAAFKNVRKEAFYLPRAPNWGEASVSQADIPIHKRVYSFINLCNFQRKWKSFLLRAREVEDEERYFVCSPEFGSFEDLMEFYHNNPHPYPDADFDAKWMVAQALTGVPGGVNR